MYTMAGRRRQQERRKTIRFNMKKNDIERAL